MGSLTSIQFRLLKHLVTQGVMGIIDRRTTFEYIQDTDDWEQCHAIVSSTNLTGATLRHRVPNGHHLKLVKDSPET